MMLGKGLFAVLEGGGGLGGGGALVAWCHGVERGSVMVGFLGVGHGYGGGGGDENSCGSSSEGWCYDVWCLRQQQVVRHQSRKV